MMSDTSYSTITIDPKESGLCEVRIKISSNHSWRWYPDYEGDGNRVVCVAITPWAEVERQEHLHEIPHHWR